MKNKLIIVIIVLLILGIVGFYFYFNNKNSNNKENLSDISNTQEKEDNNISEEENKSDDSMAGEQQMIKLNFNGKEIIVKLEDNKTTKDLISKLPLTVSFEDYANTEKIAYLDEKLSYDNDGCEPKIGDFAYYAPWGNLSFFYKDFRYSNSLIKLGTIESGIENMKELDNKTVKIELVK